MRSTIVVTGAARGIGAAIAKQLLDQGIMLLVLTVKNPEQWDISKTMTSDQSSQWQGISQDITHQQETQTLISELLEKYEITGLVNAAGVLIMRSMLEAKRKIGKHFLRSMSWRLSRSANKLLNILCKRRGSIVTISSNSARMPRMQLGMYATTKAALSHFVAIWHLKSPLIKSG